MNPAQEKLLVFSDRVSQWSLPAFALTAAASIVMQNVIWLGVAAWLLAMHLRRRWTLPSAAIAWPLLGLAAMLVVSSLTAGRLNASFFGLRKVGLMAVFFLTAAVVDQPVHANRYLNAYIIGATLCAVFSIALHLGGWDEGRTHSFSGDYMAAGGMYMLAFILAAGRFFFSRPPRRWGWLAPLAILGCGLAFTYTRSSWLGAVAGFLVLGLIKEWRLTLGLVFAGVVLFLAFPNSPLVRRAATIQSRYSSSNVERRYMWGTGLRLLADRPLLGYGVDNLSEVYGRYLNPAALEKNPPHVHDTPLQIALNGGLPALGFYVWWALAVMALGLVAWRRRRDATAPERAGPALALAAAFLGFLINGLFEFNFGTSQVITIVYFLTGLLPALALADPAKPDFHLPKKPRFLCLRPRFLGDVLMVSPVARALKRDFAGCEVDLATEESGRAVAAHEPAWDRILAVPGRGQRGALRAIRARHYDAVLDFFGNPRTARLSLFSGARLKIGPRVRGWGVVYHLRTRPDRPGIRPAWESYFDALRTLGMKQLSLRPHWKVGDAERAWARDKFRQHRLRPGKTLGIFAGGSHPAKRWPLENFLDVAREVETNFGMRSLFIFGPKEKDLNLVFRRAQLRHAAGLTGLTPGQVAALWAECALIASNDGFPMHLGPAVGTPTLGLFGPGDPRIWFPYPATAGHRSVHAAPACWPCRQDVCEDNICWRELSVDRVVAVIREIFASRKAEKLSKSSKLSK